MSYRVNQYNYATPLLSAPSFVNEEASIADKKYFTLFDNVLDGSYSPISGDVGLWGISIASADGTLPTPFVLTVEENSTIHAIRLVGSENCFPVDFSIVFYNGANKLLTVNVASNRSAEYVYYLPSTIRVTYYQVTITRISKPGSVAMLRNSYTPNYIKRSGAVTISVSEVSDTSELHEFSRGDAIKVAGVDTSVSMQVQSGASDALHIVGSHSGDPLVTASGYDTLREKLTESTKAQVTVHDAGDTLRVAVPYASHIENTVEPTADTLHAKVNEDTSHVINSIDGITDVCPMDIRATTSNNLANIHSIMKQPTRHIRGKVYITYTDPMLASETQITSNGTAYNSVLEQVLDGNGLNASDNLFFTLYENDLSGAYVVSDSNSQVGWTSQQLSDADGNFGDNPPYLRIDFSERPILNMQVTFDDSHGVIVRDFHIDYVLLDKTTVRHRIVDNDKAVVDVPGNLPNVIAVIITVTRISKAGYPVTILEVPTLSTKLYVGYNDVSNLISINLLEELTYEDSIEALGGISANEITVKLDNSTGEFFFNNTESVVASSLRRNRKIVPWLGVEIAPGEIEWYTLGTFWSYKWDVPVEGLAATVVGFDTIGLLDTTDFTNHTMQVNKSIGELIEYILNDANSSLGFIKYDIDPYLYEIVIPYAWFEAGSHTAALRKLSLCYPMHVYCDRDGVICAAPQKLHLDYYYDTWSDKTNVISKRYSSLYTVLPNIINVEVKSPAIATEQSLVDDKLAFDIALLPTRALNFNSPYVSDIEVNVQCDSTVEYTYEAYSWGVVFNFTGTGRVYSISCVGTTLDISNSTSISKRDDTSVRLNGAISRSISSDFIQTSDLALELINRIMSLSEYDKYDVEVTYRGDIALTINDPILLLDGIAPDNRYNIKRHELFWDGALSGVAHLNT